MALFIVGQSDYISRLYIGKYLLPRLGVLPCKWKLLKMARVTPRSTPLIQAQLYALPPDDSPRLPRYPSLAENLYSQTFTMHILYQYEKAQCVTRAFECQLIVTFTMRIAYYIRKTINANFLCNRTICSIFTPPFKLNSFRRPKTDHLILSQEKEAYN